MLSFYKNCNDKCMHQNFAINVLVALKSTYRRVYYLNIIKFRKMIYLLHLLALTHTKPSCTIPTQTYCSATI